MLQICKKILCVYKDSRMLYCMPLVESNKSRKKDFSYLKMQLQKSVLSCGLFDLYTIPEAM